MSETASTPKRPAALLALAALAALLSACGGSGAPSASGPAASAGPAPASALAPVHGPYAPAIEPANFTSRVDNPYFPLPVGRTWRMEGVAEDGHTPQTDTMTVTPRTKTIMGVETVVVHDRITSRGRPVENTFDWYAQDRAGNVWYFGERSLNYEHGRFVLDPGSWTGGVGGALPGIVMPADPRPGESYRQEYYPRHAMDQARVLGIGGPPLRTPYRTFRTTLSTEETTVLEPDVRERKWYARGIGEVHEADVAGSKERFSLVSVRG